MLLLYTFILDKNSNTNGNGTKRRQKGHQGSFSTFEGTEYISNVSAAISGGIESPLQIILQVRANIIYYSLK